MNNNDTSLPPEILMSPILSQKFEQIDQMIKEIKDQNEHIQSSVCDIKTYIEENRQVYLKMLETINLVSNENKKILSENRKLYTDALNKIQETEQENMDKITPIIKSMSNNTKLIENNITSPMFQSRIYNRYWRTNRFTNTQNRLRGLLGTPSISSLNLSLLNEDSNEI
jgi:phenylalanyl-tRNA synthetase alpha subunit